MVFRGHVFRGHVVFREDVTGPTINSQRFVLSVDLGGRWPSWLQKELRSQKGLSQ